MAITVTSPSRNPHDGGMYIYHALAFNTLLSSQETDAHHHRILIQYPGQPLNFTPEYLSCQLRFPELSQSQGQVAHVLLTRSPLEYPEGPFRSTCMC